MAADERRSTLIKNKRLSRVHPRSSAAKIVIPKAKHLALRPIRRQQGFHVVFETMRKQFLGLFLRERP
jgi:hypothetical protein